MKSRVLFGFIALLLGVNIPLGEAFAVTGRLRPEDFNRMYYLASKGKVGILRNAVNRGLNIDSLNSKGDPGLCIAVKKKDYIAYNSFRMSGANPKHACTYRMYDEYNEFLDTTKTVREERILGNKESLYFNEEERSWWPWILGGAAVGGGAMLLSGGGGGSSGDEKINQSVGGGNNQEEEKPNLPEDDEENIITPIERGIGLSGYIVDYYSLIEGVNAINLLDITFENKNIEDVYGIELLPNTLDMADYLRAYTKVDGGGSFVNRGTLSLNNATVGIAVHEEKSKGYNLGKIDIKAENATIGMTASNGASAFNGEGVGDDSSDINMSFKGALEGNALIGMYADTNSEIVNYGKITGTTSETVIVPDENGNFSDSLIGGGQDGEEGEEEVENKKSANAGSMIGMGIFNFYTGTNLSDNTVRAENYGNINLSAGYNAAREGGVSLIGMGSYIDDKFLNQNNNPSYAEKMELNNKGNIDLKYQGEFMISEDGLKLGDGGLLGMRADASTVANNLGKIDINLTSTTLSSGVDVAAGMLSVHGAELYNGDKNNVYSGEGNLVGEIKILNEATSGGVSYGMLASKGDGSQTRVYNWKDPKLYNYGLIDMQVSNSYAMASFDGGEVVNYGVINLGVENGHSYYTNNYGLYSEGKDITDVADLINKGIINVNSTLSTAMQQMFSGSVDMVNDGVIYISQKATGSKAFAGNFSTAVNNKNVFYKVDNSEGFRYVDNEFDEFDWNTKSTPVASVVDVAVGANATKQEFVNNGTVILGDKKSDNYNGSFGTVVAHVSEQGSAINNEYSIDENGEEKGLIWLKSADDTYRQLNAGLYLDRDAKRAAFVDNKGKIVLDAAYSMGIYNMSENMATAFNTGDIYVNGKRSYAMAGTRGSYVSNGMSGKTGGNIYLNAKNSVGLYTDNGEVYNFGSIYLNESDTFAFVLNGENAKLLEIGNVVSSKGKVNQVVYGVSGGATYKIDDLIDKVIDDYVLVKAFDGGKGVIENAKVTVSGENGRLLVSEGEESLIIVTNSDIVIDGGETAIEVKNAGGVDIEGGNISVSGEGQYGVKLKGDYNFGSPLIATLGVLDGNIEVSDGATGILDEGYSIVKYEGNIVVNNGKGLEQIGRGGSASLSTASRVDVYNGVGLQGYDLENAARIFLYSNKTCNGVMCGLDNYIKGMVSTGDEVSNLGVITGSGMTYANMGALLNGGTKLTNNGTIKNNHIGVYVGNDATLNGSGLISENYIGAYSDGGNLYFTGVLNDNSYGVYQLSGYGDIGGSMSGNTYGIYLLGGRLASASDIVAGGNTGAFVRNAKFENEGTIEVGGGIGVRVSSNGEFTNMTGGTVKADGGVCVYVENGGEALNSGTLELKEYWTEAGSYVIGKHAVVESGGVFSNIGELIPREHPKVDYLSNGTSLSNSDDVWDTIVLEEGATFINKGYVGIGNKVVDFDALAKNGGKVVIGKGGSFDGGSYIGSIIADTDIVKGGFKDVYQNENSFVGENKGVDVSSMSYMFEAKTKVDDEKINIELERKGFDEIVKDKDLAEFFETNYKLENSEKVFDSLKTAQNAKEFDERVESESGRKFYGVLARENMAVLRGITGNEKNRILDDGLNGVSMGANYLRTGKDKQESISGYNTDVYSAYIGNGVRVNKNLSYGASIMGGYVDSDYEEWGSKESKILMAFVPLLYKNGNYKYLGMANVGVGFGEYDRQSYSGSYKGDVFDIYYGISNSFEASVDVKVAELVAEAELNFMGVKSDEVKEKGGFVLKSNDSHSLEGGIGLKLRKNIKLAKERSLMVELGGKYYHEFLNPYKEMRVGMRGNDVSYNGGKYDEDKDRFKSTARAVYKDGDLSIGAEVSHNLEKESNVEGNVGVRYNF